MKRAIILILSTVLFGFLSAVASNFPEEFPQELASKIIKRNSPENRSLINQINNQKSKGNSVTKILLSLKSGQKLELLINSNSYTKSGSGETALGSINGKPNSQVVISRALDCEIVTIYDPFGKLYKKLIIKDNEVISERDVEERKYSCESLKVKVD